MRPELCEPGGNGKCRRCGQPLGGRTFRVCPSVVETKGESPRPTPARLGDWTERMLASVGVTKERYIDAKQLFHLAPTCGCDKRKEWLNKVSDWWRSSG